MYNITNWYVYLSIRGLQTTFLVTAVSWNISRPYELFKRRGRGPKICSFKLKTAFLAKIQNRTNKKSGMETLLMSKFFGHVIKNLDGSGFSHPSFWSCDQKLGWQWFFPSKFFGQQQFLPSNFFDSCVLTSFFLEYTNFEILSGIIFHGNVPLMF